MAVLVWVMVAIAFWHFTVLVPDQFWGGIVGAFIAALARRPHSGLPAALARPAVGQPARCERDDLRSHRLHRGPCAEL
jgi:hypothetical protein